MLKGTLNLPSKLQEKLAWILYLLYIMEPHYYQPGILTEAKEN